MTQRGPTQRGSAPLELALGLGLLVLPAIVLVLSFGPWLEARTFVRTAAAEAARAVILRGGIVQSSDLGFVEEMAESRGLSLLDIELCGADACAIVRGGYVTARVVVEVPLVDTPWGSVGGVSVGASHTEPVDLYRSLP